MRLPHSAHSQQLSPTKSSAVLFSFMSCLLSYWKPSALSCTFFMARPEISWVLAQDGSQHTASGVEQAILNPCAYPKTRSAPACYPTSIFIGVHFWGQTSRLELLQYQFLANSAIAVDESCTSSCKPCSISISVANSLSNQFECLRLIQQ